MVVVSEIIGQGKGRDRMNYIVKVFFVDKSGKPHNEYFEYIDIDDAKRRADSEAEILRCDEANGEIIGYSVLLYEVTDY